MAMILFYSQNGQITKIIELKTFLLFGLAANDAWNDDKKTNEGDAPQCYR